MTATQEPPPDLSQRILKLLEDDLGYQKFLGPFRPTKHDVLPIPSREQLVKFFQGGGSMEKLEAIFKSREEAIQNEKDYPLTHGFEFQQWADADELLKISQDIFISGSNRSSKSYYAAKRAVKLAVENPGKIIWCLSTSNETSVRDQQKLVRHFMPRHWVMAKQGAIPRFRYSQAKGFSDRVVVGPNGSEIRFMNYQQDREIIEGGQIDLWWADEEIPIDWITTLRGRTIDRKGKGIITFTPITGFTPSVSEYFTGSRVIKWQDCEVLPHMKLWPGGERGKVPYVMQCLNPSRHVIFFNARNNPYIDWNHLKNTWADKTQAEILIRLYGLTQKSAGNAFPKFGVHNIVPHEKVIEAFKEKPPTRYHVIDFAWNRNWTMVWFGVQRFKDRRRIYVYREWPDYHTFGEWVVASEKPDGKRGPAQDSLGSGLEEYKRVVRECESQNTGGTETIYIRYGDPRSGAAVTLLQEGTTTILDQLGQDFPGSPGLHVEPVAATAETVHVQEGCNLINSWLQYDQEKPIVPMLNEPTLYISDKCQNVISCMKTYTGLDGDKGACKDFVDCVRFAAMMDIEAHDYGPVRQSGGSY